MSETGFRGRQNISLTYNRIINIHVFTGHQFFPSTVQQKSVSHTSLEHAFRTGPDCRFIDRKTGITWTDWTYTASQSAKVTNLRHYNLQAGNRTHSPNFSPLLPTFSRSVSRRIRSFSHELKTAFKVHLVRDRRLGPEAGKTQARLSTGSVKGGSVSALFFVLPRLR